MKKVERRRLSIDIDDETYSELISMFKWGERNESILRLLRWLLEKHRTTDPMIFYAICRSGNFDMFKQVGDADGDLGRLALQTNLRNDG